MSQQQRMNQVILHIALLQDWEAAKKMGFYETMSLRTQGFIHASEPSQIMNVANYRYRGQSNLVLLCIDPEKLVAELRYEAFGTPESYPHIYGTINIGAVVKVLEFPSDANGLFKLPELDLA
jgi:uncharacterized protein (DUF952 family)